MPEPKRGDIWLGDLDPVRGHEQSGTRPLLVVSDDLFNTGPAGLVITVPLTKIEKGTDYHVQVDPPEGGLRVRSFIKCEEIRSISVLRLRKRWGEVTEETLMEVEYRLRLQLNL